MLDGGRLVSGLDHENSRSPDDYDKKEKIDVTGANASRRADSAGRRSSAEGHPSGMQRSQSRAQAYVFHGIRTDASAPRCEPSSRTATRTVEKCTSSSGIVSSHAVPLAGYRSVTNPPLRVNRKRLIASGNSQNAFMPDIFTTPLRLIMCIRAARVAPPRRPETASPAQVGLLHQIRLRRPMIGWP